MPDEITDPAPVAPAQVQINQSPAPAAAAATLRIIVLIISGAATLLGFLSKHDIAGLVVWLQSVPGIAFGSAVITLVTGAYGVLKTLGWHKIVADIIRNPKVPADVGKFK